MHAALDSARLLLLRQAGRDSLSVRVHGIGVDHGSREGLAHLKTLGPFDAVSAGDAWQSLSAKALVVGDLAGPMATPQLLVLGRVLRVVGESSRAYSEILSERLLVRKVGLWEISDWVASGAHFPRVAFANDVHSPKYATIAADTLPGFSGATAEVPPSMSRAEKIRD